MTVAAAATVLTVSAAGAAEKAEDTETAGQPDRRAAAVASQDVGKTIAAWREQVRLRAQSQTQGEAGQLDRRPWWARESAKSKTTTGDWTESYARGGKGNGGGNDDDQGEDDDDQGEDDVSPWRPY